MSEGASHFEVGLDNLLDSIRDRLVTLEDIGAAQTLFPQLLPQVRDLRRSVAQEEAKSHLSYLSLEDREIKLDRLRKLLNLESWLQKYTQATVGANDTEAVLRDSRFQYHFNQRNGKSSIFTEGHEYHDRDRQRRHVDVLPTFDENATRDSMDSIRNPQQIRQEESAYSTRTFSEPLSSGRKSSTRSRSGDGGGPRKRKTSTKSSALDPSPETRFDLTKLIMEDLRQESDDADFGRWLIDRLHELHSKLKVENKDALKNRLGYVTVLPSSSGALAVGRYGESRAISPIRNAFELPRDSDMLMKNEDVFRRHPASARSYNSGRRSTRKSVDVNPYSIGDASDLDNFSALTEHDELILASASTAAVARRRSQSPAQSASREHSPVRRPKSTAAVFERKHTVPDPFVFQERRISPSASPSTSPLRQAVRSSSASARRSSMGSHYGAPEVHQMIERQSPSRLHRTPSRDGTWTDSGAPLSPSGDPVLSRWMRLSQYHDPPSGEIVFPMRGFHVPHAQSFFDDGSPPKQTSPFRHSSLPKQRGRSASASSSKRPKQKGKKPSAARSNQDEFPLTVVDLQPQKRRRMVSQPKSASYQSSSVSPGPSQPGKSPRDDSHVVGLYTGSQSKKHVSISEGSASTESRGREASSSSYSDEEVEVDNNPSSDPTATAAQVHSAHITTSSEDRTNAKNEQQVHIPPENSSRSTSVKDDPSVPAPGSAPESAADSSALGIDKQREAPVAESDGSSVELRSAQKASRTGDLPSNQEAPATEDCAVNAAPRTVSEEKSRNSTRRPSSSPAKLRKRQAPIAVTFASQFPASDAAGHSSSAVSPSVDLMHSLTDALGSASSTPAPSTPTLPPSSLSPGTPRRSAGDSRAPVHSPKKIVHHSSVSPQTRSRSYVFWVSAVFASVVSIRISSSVCCPRE
eukprot:ANDGO_05167.mRNA.1 hypothetical protein